MIVISDTNIKHRSETRGVVVTRVQIIEINGKRFKASYWSHFETGKLHHIDSVTLTGE